MRAEDKRLADLIRLVDGIGSSFGSTIEAGVWRQAARLAGSGGGRRELVAVFEARARAAEERPQKCRQCGRPVERDRRVYAVPTCHACLPPPPPLPRAVLKRLRS